MVLHLVPSLHTNRWGNSGNSDRLYFWGLQNHCNGDCSHEIKRRLLLERKVMTNLDSILKSKDIILPTKVCQVKPMVFLVVMYGCESWTIKKAVQFSLSVMSNSCSPMNCSMPGLPVHHQLPEFTQTDVH